ncbi:MAG: PilN domain-containing protein [Gammaproteobacteria bacterium]|nr:PilN domain-containing protein [Gammaproteobacteria bacterium]
MPHINLLPWREALKKEREKQFYVSLGVSVVVGALLVGAAHYYMSELISHQKGRNTLVTNEIARLDGQIKEITEIEKKRDALVSRMQIIERLQTERPQVVHLFDEMVKMVPDGLYLKTLNVSGDVVSIAGEAESNARVSTFMQALENSDWFENPNLAVIQAQGDRLRSFTLTVKQVKKKAE